jgi:hypothetical protein
MLTERANKFFAEDTNNLIALGRLVATDIAFNNPDRFPINMVWDGKGNAGNFLFGLESVGSIDLREDLSRCDFEFGTLVAIDN